MSGSVAEERIRAKVEAELRARYPDARIVHELVLDQGGVRIDLAAVTTDSLIVAEVKSERDTLKRLQSQVETALRVAQQVWVVVAEKHAPALAQLNSCLVEVPRAPPVTRISDGALLVTQLANNPNRIRALRHCYLYAEGERHFRFLNEYGRPPEPVTPRPDAVLQMLWAGELRRITGCGTRSNRDQMIRLALENLTGAQIRQAVCQAVRSRPFPRADQQAA